MGMASSAGWIPACGAALLLSPAGAGAALPYSPVTAVGCRCEGRARSAPLVPAALPVGTLLILLCLC